ncbi:unnamed protein product [Cunninghamella blakesleeana]
MPQHTQSKSTSYRPIAPFIAPSTTNSWRLDNQRELRISDSASLSPVTNQFHIDDNMDDPVLDQKTRRKEQNRAAQRAFRERKEKYVKELETKIKQMEIKHNKALASKEKEIETLQHRVIELEKELNKLKGIPSDNHHHLEMTTSALKATKIYDEEDNNNHNSNSNDEDTLNDQDNNSNHTNSDDTMMMLINDDDDTDSELHDLDMMESKQHNDNNNNMNDDSDLDDDNGGFLKLLPKYHQFNKSPSSAVACIRDKDGVSFCERLKEEVCSSAYNQLLSESLFDASGAFNEKVTDHPVPIVTENLPKDHPDHNNRHHPCDNNSHHHSDDNHHRTISFLDRLNETLMNDNFDFSSPHPDTLNPNNELISCSKAWHSLSTHSKFDIINVDLLCTELKKIAKCSNDGPVFCQHDLNLVLKWMDTI